MIDLRVVECQNEGHQEILFGLLRVREPHESISHRFQPTFEQHCAFIASNPYKDWRIIVDDDVCYGAIYITHRDEIGIHLFPACREKGVGTIALTMMMKIHGKREYFANISPANTDSQAFFERHGFKHIQNTYRLDVK